MRGLDSRTPRQRLAPVLACAVHAGMIGLLVRGAPTADPPRRVTGTRLTLPVYTPYRLRGEPAGGESGPGMDAVSAPTPAFRPAGLSDLPDPIHLSLSPGPGPDPRRLVLDGQGNRPVMWDRAVSPGAGPEAPVLLEPLRPVYPEPLRRAGIGGTVVVTYIVDVQGTVQPASIAFVSCDHPLLGEAVRQALLEARLSPARVHGRPVPARVRQVLHFVTMEAPVGVR